MRAHLLTATIATVLCAGSIATPAFAQETPPPSSSPPASGEPSPPPPVPTEAQQRALIHYERGRAYYAAGRYRIAARELEAAAALDPNGYNLYFDLGLVYERLGNIDGAVVAYRHYVDHVTDPAEHERAERILYRVRGARAEIADINRGHGDADGWFWLAAALSIGALASGTVLLVTQPSTDHTAQIAGDTLLVSGGALAVTAALLYLVRLAPPRHTPRCITANVGSRGAMLGFSF